MLTMLMSTLIISGLFLIPVFPLVGVPLAFVGFKLQRAASHDEDVFENTMSTLAGLGAFAFITRGLWIEITARL